MKSFSEFISEASENQRFFDNIYNRARALGANDIEAKTIAAQGSLETGYGKYPSGSFNYFGQKGTSGENTSRMSTREVVGGRDVRVNADFKNYDSLDSSIRDRINKWSYKTRGAESVEQAAQRLQIPGNQPIPGSRERSHGAYATDPNYASSVARIARDYGGSINKPGSASSSPSKPVIAKGSLDTPTSTKVLAKLKGKTGELDKSTGKFSTRDWSSTEGERYKTYGGK